MEKKRILLVDDDELITMSLEMIISAEAEFEIIGKGCSGREAVTLFDELTPDLLLMDIRMKSSSLQTLMNALGHSGSIR